MLVSSLRAIATRVISARAPQLRMCSSAANDGGIAKNEDQATGLEREEVLAELDGKDYFEGQLVAPFGTKESPVVVQSIFAERIVGCPGHCDQGDTTNFNEVQWFTVKEGSPYVCPDCNQYFTLERIQPSQMSE